MRGIAAIAVFITHLGTENRIILGMSRSNFMIFDWAEFAVDLFFILSGFIMNWVYCVDEEKPINWSGYLLARCARILPLYYLTLAFFLPSIIGIFLHYGFFYDHKILALFLGNISLLSGFGGSTYWYWNFNAPSWSISIEFFAYLLLFPLMVGIKRRYQLSGAAVIAIISWIGMLLCYANISHQILGWDWTRFARGLFGFPLGFVICSFCKSYRLQKPIISDLAIFLLGATILLSILNFIPRIFIAFSTPLLVFFTAFDKGLICSWLKMGIFQWTGERSYSIYLWHTPIMYILIVPYVLGVDAHAKSLNINLGWFNSIVTIVLVLVISDLSFRFFESPIRKVARRYLSNR